MTEWVSQSEARKLLADLGDVISQPALSQYLAGHPEITREEGGPGRPTKIDWHALKQSRSTRTSRGPASEPAAAPRLPLMPPAGGPAAVVRDRPRDELSERRAKADTDRAEFDARRARIQAEEAEGRLIPREKATGAFMAAGAALVTAQEEGRRGLIDKIRAAPDARSADLALRSYETAVRTAFATSLTEFAALADPDTAAAAE